MRFVSHWRTLTWVILIVSSVPLQLFFHASVFATSVYTYYAHVMVSESFFDGASAWYPGVANPSLASWAFVDLNQANASKYDFRNARERWDRMEASECWSNYMHDPAGLQYHRHLAMVVETTKTPSTGNAGWKGSEIWSNGTAEPPEDWNYPDFDPEQVNSIWSVNEWCQADIFYTGLLNYCADDYGQHGAYLPPEIGYDGSNSTTSSDPPEPWTFPWFSPETHPLDNMWYEQQPFGELNPGFDTITIKHCYAEPFVSRCKVYVANPILLGVLMVVLIKCIVSAFVFYKSWGLDSIQTLGDATQYFMRQDEPVGDAVHFSRLQDAPDDAVSTPVLGLKESPLTSRPWTPTRKYWYMAVRKPVWLWTMAPCILFIACVVATIIYLHLSFFHLGWHDYSFGEDMNNHYLNFYNSYYDPNLSDTIVPLILIALLSNLSQLIIAPIYFLLNSINKIMFQSGTWAKFALRPKRLRVSFPRADEQQLGDYAFGYPLFWGLLFAAFRTGLGWMFTQSIFMLPRGRLEYWTDRNEIDITQVGVVIGYSVQALVLSIAFCIIVFFILPLVIGFRRLPDQSVLVGTNSLVIAAQCARVRGAASRLVSPSSTWSLSETKPSPYTGVGKSKDKDPSTVNITVMSAGSSTRSTTTSTIASTFSKTGKIVTRDLRSLNTAPRHAQPLMWGVLEPGDEVTGRPGYLGLGTKEEVMGPPVPGRAYISASVEWFDDVISITPSLRSDSWKTHISSRAWSLRFGWWKRDSQGRRFGVGDQKTDECTCII